MGEQCDGCGKDLDGGNCVREYVAGIHRRLCWPCTIKAREQEAELADPKTFLSGLGFGLAIGFGAWLAFGGGSI